MLAGSALASSLTGPVIISQTSTILIVILRFRNQAVSLTVSVMVLNSVSIISSDFLPDLFGQAVFSAIFGFTFGCYISSVMVVLSLTTASRTSLTSGESPPPSAWSSSLPASPPWLDPYWPVLSMTSPPHTGFCLSAKYEHKV